MIIDFETIDQKQVEGFKGGKGPMLTQMADDGHVKIMRNTLRPGSSIGMHTHEGNCEVIYVLQGEITFICDGQTETAAAGCVHYCPCGHTHTAENRTETDAEFFAIVPENK